MAFDGERTKFAALDKKQRKFDQSLADEKAISERLALAHWLLTFVLATTFSNAASAVMYILGACRI
jgi:hypothetical protein